MSEMSSLQPRHFLWSVTDRIATLRLMRPER